MSLAMVSSLGRREHAVPTVNKITAQAIEMDKLRICPPSGADRILKDLFRGLPVALILYGANTQMKAVGMMSPHPPGIRGQQRGRHLRLTFFPSREMQSKN